MIKLTHTVISFTFLFAVFGCSKKAEITGMVVDNFGKAVEGATVKIQNTSFQSQTGADGRYKIEYIPGRIILLIAKEGYSGVNMPLDISVKAEFPAEQVTLFKYLPGNDVYRLANSAYEPLPMVKLACSVYNVGSMMDVNKGTYNSCKLKKISEDSSVVFSYGDQIALASARIGQEAVIYKVLSNGLVAAERDYSVRGKKEITAAPCHMTMRSSPIGGLVQAKLEEGQYVLTLTKLPRHIYMWRNTEDAWLINVRK